jgi:hypothetical protein
MYPAQQLKKKKEKQLEQELVDYSMSLLIRQ